MATALRPAEYKLRYNLGHFLVQLGKGSEGEAHLRKAIEGPLRIQRRSPVNFAMNLGTLGGEEGYETARALEAKAFRDACAERISGLTTAASSGGVGQEFHRWH